jgi:hypothetical protein
MIGRFFGTSISNARNHASLINLTSRSTPIRSTERLSPRSSRSAAARRRRKKRRIRMVLMERN